MFCAPGLVSGGTEGVGYRFYFLRSRTHFGRYRGRRVPFSSFAITNTFWVVRRPSGLIFKFCSLGHVFGGTEGVGSRFHVLRSPTHFRQYRGRRGSISCFALPDSFSTVARTLWPVGIFCARGHIFEGTEGVGPVFMFCTPRLVSGGTEAVGARFHVLRSRTLFQRNRGRRVRFSYFALSDSFRAVPRASGLVFKFCAPKHIFGGTEGVGSHFQQYLSRQGSISCFALSESF
jgi:hypothetical protein